MFCLTFFSQYSHDSQKVESHLVWISDKTQGVTLNNFPALLFFNPVNYHTLLYFHGMSSGLGSPTGKTSTANVPIFTPRLHLAQYQECVMSVSLFR